MAAQKVFRAACGAQAQGKGMYDEAIAANREGMALGGYSPEEVAGLGRVYELEGMRGYWRWRARHAHHPSQWLMVFPLVQLGEKDRALPAPIR